MWRVLESFTSCNLLKPCSCLQCSPVFSAGLFEAGFALRLQRKTGSTGSWMEWRSYYCVSRPLGSQPRKCFSVFLSLFAAGKSQQHLVLKYASCFVGLATNTTLYCSTQDILAQDNWGWTRTKPQFFVFKAASCTAYFANCILLRVSQELPRVWSEKRQYNCVQSVLGSKIPRSWLGCRRASRFPRVA